MLVSINAVKKIRTQSKNTIGCFYIVQCIFPVVKLGDSDLEVDRSPHGDLRRLERGQRLPNVRKTKHENDTTQAKGIYIYICVCVCLDGHAFVSFFLPQAFWSWSWVP